MFGRQARLPVDLMFETPPPAEQSFDEFAQNLKVLKVLMKSETNNKGSSRMPETAV